MNEPLHMIGPTTCKILKSKLAFRCCDVCKLPEDCKGWELCWEDVFKLDCELSANDGGKSDAR